MQHFFLRINFQRIVICGDIRYLIAEIFRNYGNQIGFTKKES